MASTHKSLRSGTANKRPTTSIADGQIALNTNVASPGLYFKDSTGASIIKIGPVHVGTTAPNVAPAGSSGNSTGEAWLDTSLTPNGWKVWTGAAWTNATPVGSDTVQGLLELATNAETQAGSDTARAVTPAGLQSKVSDSTSTTSSTTIASSTAVKSAYDLANAALPKSGGTVTGNLEIGTSGSLTFEGATADAFETTLAVVDPTADRTITLPNVTGTVVTTGDTGTVTSTMILDGTILNADVNASAAIAGTKISPDFGSQNAVTTGTSTAASFIPTSSTVPTNGVYLPAANNVAISTGGSGRLFVDASGNVGVNTSSPSTYGRFAVVDSQNGYVSSTFTNTSNGSGAVNRIQIGNDASPGSGQLVVYGSQHSTLPNIFDINNANNAALRFLTNNTERLRITGSGLVGVGTSVPGSLLSVKTTGGSDLFYVDDNTSKFYFSPNGSGEGIIKLDTANAIRFLNAGGERLRISSSGNVGIGTSAINSFAPSSGDSVLTFSTRQAATLSEKVRIDQLGRLGIGTAIPSQLLHCERTTAGVTALFGVNDGTFNPRLVVYGGSTGTTIQNTWSSSASNLIFANGGAVGSGTEAMRIDSSGRVGIGTSGPNTKLTLVSNTSVLADNAIRVNGSANAQSSNSGLWISGNQSTAHYNWLIGSQYNVNGGFEITPSTAIDGATFSTPALVVTAAGQCGIGVTGPTRQLDVNRTAIFDSNGDGTTTSPSLAIGSSGVGFSYIGSQQLAFITNSTERARIDSSGRLLVGTSTSAGGDALQQISGVGSSTRPKLQLFHWEAGDGAAQLIFSKSRGSSFGSYTVVNSGDELGGLFFQGSNGSAFGTGARIDAVVDSAWGSGDYPTRLVFSTTAGGASSPTEAFRINSFQKPIFGGPTIRCLATYNSTTASAANQFVDSAGDFYRSTSSIKYKTNVETIEDHYSDALLQCHPVWYQSTCEADNPDWGHWGFIAEEVAQIDPRLCFFKEEEDGSLEPEGVQYDRFVPHLLNLIKRQKEQIEAMEARLSALEAQ
jgi:hypothetical protein